MAFLTDAKAFFERVPHPIAWKADPGLTLQTPGPETENKVIQSACSKRRREFRSGRNVARAALQALGQPTVSLPSDAHRRPIWPKGIHGSISHCDDLAMAVAARGLSGIGVDVERAEPLSAEVSRYIMTGADIEFTPYDVDCWSTRVFCAKEAFYKAVSHRLSFVPDFDEAAIYPLETDAFSVIALSSRLRGAHLAWRVQGWHTHAEGHQLALAVLSAPPAGTCNGQESSEGAL